MMMKDSKVMGVRVPQEYEEDYRIAHAKARMIGVPFYRIMASFVREFINDERIAPNIQKTNNCSV